MQKVRDAGVNSRMSTDLSLVRIRVFEGRGSVAVNSGPQHRVAGLCVPLWQALHPHCYLFNNPHIAH